MTRNRLWFVGLMCVLPAAAQVSVQHGPARQLQRHANGTYTSGNWAGYALTGSAFTFVSGSWTVPTVNCGGTLTTYSSAWVGLDGFAENPNDTGTVEQTGTGSKCVSGVPTYYAWYEFYPNPEETFDLTIHAGDRMSGEVSYSNGHFHITLTDETTGQSIETSNNLASAKRLSAECVAEDPAQKNPQTGKVTLLPFAPFGFSFFGSDNTGVSGTCYAKDSSTAGPFGAFGNNAWQVTMVNASSVAQAVPSGLSADGTSFSVEATGINVENIYGQPGTANVQILDASGKMLYFDSVTLKGSSSNTTPSTNLSLTSLNLTGAGSPYTFVIVATGSSGFGPGFMNFVLTASSDLLFSNGTVTYSGLTYENQPPIDISFSSLNIGALVKPSPY